MYTGFICGGVTSKQHGDQMVMLSSVPTSGAQPPHPTHLTYVGHASSLYEGLFLPPIYILCILYLQCFTLLNIPSIMFTITKFLL